MPTVLYPDREPRNPADELLDDWIATLYRGMGNGESLWDIIRTSRSMAVQLLDSGQATIPQLRAVISQLPDRANAIDRAVVDRVVDGTLQVIAEKERNMHANVSGHTPEHRNYEGGGVHEARRGGEAPPAVVAAMRQVLEFAPLEKQQQARDVVTRMADLMLDAPPELGEALTHLTRELEHAYAAPEPSTACGLLGSRPVGRALPGTSGGPHATETLHRDLEEQPDEHARRWKYLRDFFSTPDRVRLDAATPEVRQAITRLMGIIREQDTGEAELGLVHNLLVLLGNEHPATPAAVENLVHAILRDVGHRPIGTTGAPPPPATREYDDLVEVFRENAEDELFDTLVKVANMHKRQPSHLAALKALVANACIRCGQKAGKHPMRTAAGYPQHDLSYRVSHQPPPPGPPAVGRTAAGATPPMAHSRDRVQVLVGRLNGWGVEEDDLRHMSAVLDQLSRHPRYFDAIERILVKLLNNQGGNLRGDNVRGPAPDQVLTTVAGFVHTAAQIDPGALKSMLGRATPGEVGAFQQTIYHAYQKGRTDHQAGR